jgi:hypothetical protein
MATKNKTINDDIEKALNRLLKEVMRDPSATLTDRCKVIDRAMKWESIKQNNDAGKYGEGFGELEEADEPEEKPVAKEPEKEGEGNE